MTVSVSLVLAHNVVVLAFSVTIILVPAPWWPRRARTHFPAKVLAQKCRANRALG